MSLLEMPEELVLKMKLYKCWGTFFYDLKTNNPTVAAIQVVDSYGVLVDTISIR
jgi:hypothetical protein